MEESKKTIFAHKSKFSVVTTSIKILLLGLVYAALVALVELFIIKVLGFMNPFILLLIPLIIIIFLINFFCTSYVEYDESALYERHLFWPGKKKYYFADISAVNLRYKKEERQKNKYEKEIVEVPIWTICVKGQLVTFNYLENSTWSDKKALFDAIRKVNGSLKVNLSEKGKQETSNQKSIPLYGLSLNGNQSNTAPGASPLTIKCPNCGASNLSNRDSCKSCGAIL